MRLKLVMKVTKFCNLRCRYCYEFDYLSDKRRMTTEIVETVFDRIEAERSKLEISNVSFIWHGGEPMVLAPDFYDRVGEMQNCLGMPVRNSVQTNLTIIHQGRLEFLKSGRFFKDVGVSVDPFNSSRVALNGRDSTSGVLENLDLLLEGDSRVSAITVLSRPSLPFLAMTFQFFDTLGLPYRFLPYYKSASETQKDQNALTFEEHLSFIQTLFMSWMASERSTQVDPLRNYLVYAARHISGHRLLHETAEKEISLLVDVDGTIWNPFDDYVSEGNFGSLTRAPLSQILDGDARRASMRAAEDDVGIYCHKCEFFGACPGEYVLNASDNQRTILKESGCVVRAALRTISDGLSKVMPRLGMDDLDETKSPAS